MSLRSSNYSKNEILALVFVFHSTFLPRETFSLFHWGDVGRSMFDVHLFQQTFHSPSGAKNNLALIKGGPGHGIETFIRLFCHGFLYFKQISVIILDENNQIISLGNTFNS